MSPNSLQFSNATSSWILLLPTPLNLTCYELSTPSLLSSTILLKCVQGTRLCIYALYSLSYIILRRRGPTYVDTSACMPKSYHILCKSLSLHRLSYWGFHTLNVQSWLRNIHQKRSTQVLEEGLGLCGQESSWFCIYRAGTRSWAWVLGMHDPLASQNLHTSRKGTARGGPEWDSPKCIAWGRVISSVGLWAVLIWKSWFMTYLLNLCITPMRIRTVCFFVRLSFSLPRFGMCVELFLTEPKSEVWVEGSLSLLPAYGMLVTKLSVLYMFSYLILKTFEKDIELRGRKYIPGRISNLVKVTWLVSSRVGIWTHICPTAPAMLIHECCNSFNSVLLRNHDVVCMIAGDMMVRKSDAVHDLVELTLYWDSHGHK